MNYEQLSKIRDTELQRVLHYFPEDCLCLELGAGTGQQAKRLREHGVRVIPIDIPTSNHQSAREIPIVEFDGLHIPLPDHSVDVIFSSNVLEHIAEIDVFQTELQRVLKMDGRAIHLIPTSSWRFWTLVAYVPFVAMRVWQKSIAILSHTTVQPVVSEKRLVQIPASRRNWLNWLPTRHGARGNLWTEFYYFNQRHWVRLFKKSAWQIQEVRPNGLFYTGYYVTGTRLSIQARSRLSQILGSSCMIYVLTNPP